MGYNTSSLLDMLDGAFGSIDQETISTASIPKAKEIVTEDIPSTPSPAESGPVGVELVFPTQVVPLVIAGIPESLLPIHGPEVQSCYRCQFTDCTQIFLQKAAACTHVCHDHLNVVLACLYCSGRDNPKMQCIYKMAFPYFPMTLPLPNYPQRPYPLLLAPPPNLFP